MAINIDLQNLSEKLVTSAECRLPLLAEDALAIDAYWEQRNGLAREDRVDLAKAIQLCLYLALFFTPNLGEPAREEFANRSLDRLRELTRLQTLATEPGVRIQLAIALSHITVNEPSLQRRYELVNEISDLHDHAQESEVRQTLATALYNTTLKEQVPSHRYSLIKKISTLYRIGKESEVRIALSRALHNAMITETDAGARQKIIAEIREIRKEAQEPEVRRVLAGVLCDFTNEEPVAEHRLEITNEISAMHDVDKDPEVRVALTQALVNCIVQESDPTRGYELSKKISDLHDVSQDPEIRARLSQALLTVISREGSAKRRHEMASQILNLYNIAKEPVVKQSLGAALSVCCGRSEMLATYLPPYRELLSLAQKSGSDRICGSLSAALWWGTQWIDDPRLWKTVFDYAVLHFERENDPVIAGQVRHALSSSLRHLEFSYIRYKLVNLLASSLTRFLESAEEQDLFGTAETEMRIFEKAVSLIAREAGGTRLAHAFLQQFRGVSAWKRDYAGGATDAKAILDKIVRSHIELENYTLVLEYVVTEDKTFLFTSSKTGVESYELTVVGRSIGRHKVDDNSHLNWAEHLKNKEFAQLHLLPIQVQQEINRSRRVVICAFGDLSTFSFAQLPALQDKLLCHAYSMSDHIRSLEQAIPSKLGPKVMALCAGDDRLKPGSLLKAISIGDDPTPFSTKVIIKPVKSVEYFKNLFPDSTVLGHYDSTPKAFANAYMAPSPPGLFIYFGHNDVEQGRPFLRLVNEDGEEERFYTEQLHPRKARIPIGIFNACKGTEGGAAVEAHNSSGYRFILSGCRTAIVTTKEVNFGALNQFIVPFLLKELKEGFTAEVTLYNLRRVYESGKLVSSIQSEETVELKDSDLREAVYAFVVFGDPNGKL